VLRARLRMRDLTTAKSRAADPAADRRFFVFNAVVSTTALLLLGWLLLIRRGAGGPGAVDLRFLPAVNASLNAAAAILLLAGRVAIQRGSMRAHRLLMVAAFAASSLFLVSYLAYHAVHGDTRYGGTGVMRTVYLTVLATHVLLSTTVVPLALTAFWFALRREFRRHRRVTRVLWPIWMYVSVTGVAIFFMLRSSYGR
jgi:putative membrane protein